MLLSDALDDLAARDMYLPSVNLLLLTQAMENAVDAIEACNIVEAGNSDKAQAAGKTREARAACDSRDSRAARKAGLRRRAGVAANGVRALNLWPIRSIWALTLLAKGNHDGSTVHP